MEEVEDKEKEKVGFLREIRDLTKGIEVVQGKFGYK
jgi:hypothetical protein